MGNTKNNTYGTYYKIDKDKFQVQFWNPLKQKSENSSIFDNEEDAKNELNRLNFEFFIENPWLLPKSISLNRRDGKYVFGISVGKKKIKTVFIAQHKDLNEIVKIRNEYVMNILN